MKFIFSGYGYLKYWGWSYATWKCILFNENRDDEGSKWVSDGIEPLFFSKSHGGRSPQTKEVCSG